MLKRYHADTGDASAFEIYPAIDLRAGRVVRLVEGDFERETAYSDDPVSTAVELVGQGSRWLHVVDLDGARDGRPVHGPLIAAIVQAVGEQSRVEVGGGIRDAESAARLLESGAERVVVGTAALNSSLAGDLVGAFGPEHVAVAIDVRGERAVGSGWQQAAGEASEFIDVVTRLLGQGVQTFEVTAIDRDGTLSGPNLDLLAQVIAAAPAVRIIASGGIRSIEDLRAVRRLGCAGAIVGRAIYEGSLDLKEALGAV